MATTQMQLLDPGRVVTELDAEREQADWRLDAADRERGRKGIEAARDALRRARPQAA